MDGKSTEHHFTLYTDLSHFLADTVEEKKLYRIGNRFVLEAFKLLIQTAERITYGLSTNLLAIKLLSNTL